jgi:deoxycytidylate deaminase
MKYLLNEEHDKAWKLLLASADIAKDSSCLRSRCGSIITNQNGSILGCGWNSLPCNKTPEVCIKDSLPKDFKSDKTCCVHAEQRAITNALMRGNDVKDGIIYFVRLDEVGCIKHSGSPYCTICSKMCLDTGIKEFVMNTKNGIASYPMEEFNDLSFKYKKED